MPRHVVLESFAFFLLDDVSEEAAEVIIRFVVL